MLFKCPPFKNRYPSCIPRQIKKILAETVNRTDQLDFYAFHQGKTCCLLAMNQDLIDAKTPESTSHICRKPLYTSKMPYMGAPVVPATAVELRAQGSFKHVG